MRSRSRRSLRDLASIVKKLTGFSPLVFIFYGNWCGFGGTGEPVDPIDKCCMLHDWCYDRVNDRECSVYYKSGPYFLRYKWHIRKSGKVVCGLINNKCLHRVCKCDIQLAQCLQEHRDAYNATYSTGRIQKVES
ncbi:phospholipase A2 Scol/Pla-like isoform X2 [Tachypleus tridentatus]